MGALPTISYPNETLLALGFHEATLTLLRGYNLGVLSLLRVVYHLMLWSLLCNPTNNGCIDPRHSCSMKLEP